MSEDIFVKPNTYSRRVWQNAVCSDTKFWTGIQSLSRFQHLARDPPQYCPL